MDVFLPLRSYYSLGLLHTVADLKLPRLVIRAVGAGDELFILLLVRKVCFQIVLLRGRIVEGSRNNVDNLVREAEGLVEFFRGRHHLVKVLPAVLSLAQDELFDLLELVHTEQTPSVPSMAPRFFAEASAVAAVFDG